MADRAMTRPVYLTDDEFVLLHDLIVNPPDVDLVIDVEGMTVEDQLPEVRGAWYSAAEPRSTSNRF
ncbi:hypothetical protein BJH93_09090 [Kocuria polaris]|nr:hypothetical protein [Kocuria polaris]